MDFLGRAFNKNLGPRGGKGARGGIFKYAKRSFILLIFYFKAISLMVLSNPNSL